MRVAAASSLGQRAGAATRWLLTLMAVAPLAVRAADWTATEEGLRDLKQGRCEVAVDGFNRGLKEGDPRAYYWVGFLFHHGLCVAQAPARAVPYLELAAKHRVAAAARLMVLTHGLGQGAPQSYAEAGRWTQAGRDIVAIQSGKEIKKESTAEEGSVEKGVDAEALGILGTMWALLPEKIRHPNMSLAARLSASQVTIPVVLRVGPSGLRYSLSRAKSEVEADLTQLFVRRSNLPHQELVQEGFEAALREMPPFMNPQKNMTVETEIAFVVAP